MMNRRAATGRGFTLFEFALAASVLGVLVAVLVSRLLFYHKEAERVAAQQLIGTLRTALAVRSAELAAAGETDGLVALAAANPMALLSENPANYLGEFYAPALAELPRGRWFFDRADRTLVYLFSTHQNFSYHTSIFLKFKVKSLRLPDSADKKGRSNAVTGVTLDQVSDQAAQRN